VKPKNQESNPNSNPILNNKISFNSPYIDLEAAKNQNNQINLREVYLELAQSEANKSQIITSVAREKSNIKFGKIKNNEYQDQYHKIIKEKMKNMVLLDVYKSDPN
jgi:hypothetical protein